MLTGGGLVVSVRAGAAQSPEFESRDQLATLKTAEWPKITHMPPSTLSLIGTAT